MKTLSMHRPLPSIEIRVPVRFNRSVQVKDVNGLSVFMIPGAPKWRIATRSRKPRPTYRSTA